ncbi:MAG: FAD-binding oxidoreductase [Phycisphaeraceae bacterium]|nr:FAD-binding oxidoreductase [Phycisphaeraceae bacterium]MCW5755188.1 FAD-binding oxidoreductase [Phycisphaeraceae bacterium]
MTVSLWRRIDRRPRVQTDVIVIGGGICGLSAGIELRSRGVGFLVLERGAVGSGASTRNAGFLMRGAAENYSLAIRDYGRTLARTVWRWTEENLALLRRDGVEQLPSFAPRASCLLALEPEEHAELQQSIGQMREDGFDVDWIDRGDDVVWRNARPLGGLINPHDAVVNPAELIAMLASRLRGNIREQQEVFEITPTDEGVRVGVADAVYVAPRVLLCTNAYTASLVPQLAGAVTPRRGQMLAVHAPGVSLPFAYYANRGSEYFRQAGHETIVVGGCRTYHADVEIGTEDVTTPLIQTALERFAAAILGANHRILARWAGAMGFSPDGLPLIGPIQGLPGAYFCGGFTGHGMSMARRSAAAAVAEMLDGGTTPFPLTRLDDGPIDPRSIASPA